MKKAIKALEMTMKCLEKEWEQSGESRYCVQITREDAEMILFQIKQFEQDKKPGMENMEEVPFREILSLVKENYVALRIARKCKKAYEKMMKKGHCASIINLDREEKQILHAVLPEFEI